MAKSVNSNKIDLGHEIIDPDEVALEESIEKGKEENRLIFNRTHIKYFFELMAIRINDGICINSLEDDNEYMTSDNPVIVTNKKEFITGQGNPTNFLRLPINRKKCLVIYPHGKNDMDTETIYRRNLNDEFAELESILMSRSQYYQSHNLIIGCEKSLALLSQYNDMTESDIMKIGYKAQDRMNKMLADAMKKWN